MFWLRYVLFWLAGQRPAPVGWTPGIPCDPAVSLAAQRYLPQAMGQGLCVTECPGPAKRPQPRTDNWGLGWLNFQNLLSQEMLSADLGKGFEVVLYGDSITENWRGTTGGVPYPVGMQIYEVYRKYFISKRRTTVMAISGDQVGHLWWRMLHGEIATVHPANVAVVLIGTNDLTAADCDKSEASLLVAANATLWRIEQVLTLLRQSAPSTQVIVQGILPRAADFQPGATHAWPNRYAAAISFINKALEDMASHGSHLHYAYCGRMYLGANGIGLNKAYLEDGLHPNAAGMELMAQCLQPLIDKLTAPPMVS